MSHKNKAEVTMKKITNKPAKAKNYTAKNKYSYKKVSKQPDKKQPLKPREGSFLYLLPENTSAKELHDELDFLNEKQLEVWTELNLLEITTDDGTVTFEDMRENLSEDDFRTLECLGIKKVYAVDYYLADKSVLCKVMEELLSKFGGKIGSDTEDFQPFISVKEI